MEDERRTFLERPQYNFQNGQFLKGHQPFNKGKKWDEWMDGRKQRKVRRIAMKNLRPRMDIGGWNKKACVGVFPDGTYRYFESLQGASEKLGIRRENIRATCKGRRKRAGGIFWFYWDDDAWVNKCKEIKAEQEAQERKKEAERGENEYRKMIRSRADASMAEIV